MMKTNSHKAKIIKDNKKWERSIRNEHQQKDSTKSDKNLAYCQKDTREQNIKVSKTMDITSKHIK